MTRIDLSIMRTLPESGPARTVNDAEFSPDGSQVATADGDGKVRVYDAATGKAVMTLDAGEAEATSVAFSPDGTRSWPGTPAG